MGSGGQNKIQIIKRKDRKEVYTVVERSKTCHELVKVLNQYDTHDEAIMALIEGILGNITEEELLKQYI